MSRAARVCIHQNGHTPDARKLIITTPTGLAAIDTFTPDMRWVVFRSNMLGPTHVVAVEITSSSAR